VDVRRALPLLVLVLLPLAGCGGGEEAGPEAEPASQPADTGAAPAPEQPPVAISEADTGKTVALPLGGETNLRLTSDYAWEEPVVAGEAVVLTRVDYIQDPGFREWVVTAAAPGEATITAHGEPACAGQDGCADAPLDFTVRITVSG
jgi:hypothetical protein